MKIENIKNECTGCMACLNICPKECIVSKFDDEGFYYPEIDKSKCVECGKCENVCHILNPLQHFEMDEKHSFYGKSKDDIVLKKSTSGGAFYHIAKSIIKNGGNVYGAYFNLKERVLKHDSSDNVGLESLLKSKYIESDMKDVISQIQKDINNGRRVLFCGTPCQASGVKKAVIDTGGLLVIVDFVCHGVPSQKLFQEHLIDLIDDKELFGIDFRPKDKGWVSKNLYLKLSNETRIIPYNLDNYYFGFMTHNAFLRRSCYNCSYRDVHASDITIADFWGYKEIVPDIDVKNGLSMIVTHTKKGLFLVNEIIDEFELNEMDNKYSDYAFQKRTYKEGSELRKTFYSLYKDKGFKYAASKTYMKGIWKKKLKYRIKLLLRRI